MATAAQMTPVQRLEKDGKRVSEILCVAVRYGLADLVENIPVPGGRAVLKAVEDSQVADETKEARVRMALTELGTTFIKIGQMLATRPDLVGPALAEELSKLQTDTPANPAEVAFATIERDLGRPVNVLYSFISPEPVASASIAQVHMALLHSGARVAVKVQKQGIEEKIEADLSVLESLAELVEERSEEYKAWEPVRLVKEFRRSILDELDFVRELGNIETFQRNFADDPNVHFAQTWPELCGRRVLTMEFLEGVPGTNLEAMRASCADLSAFAHRGAKVYLDMVFRDAFYHADPHPGNLLMLPGEVVGIVDCGMVGRVDEGLREDLEGLVGAVTEGDADWLASTIWPHTKGQPESAKELLRNDFAVLLNESKKPIGGLDVGAILTGVFEVFRKYRVTPRPGLSQLLRMLIVLNGTGQRLSPDFNLESLLEPYRDVALRRRLEPGFLWHRFQRAFIEWDRFLQSFPGELTSTLQRVRTGEFRVGLEHRHLDSVVNRLVLGILTSSLILGSSMLWSMKAPPTVGGVSLLGAVGFAVAVFLGAVLFRAVRRSGKTVSKD